MSDAPARIAAARDRLAAAGARLRERDPARSLASLASLLDAWCEPGSRLQARLADALPAAAGFSPATVREDLARGLAPWSGAALRELVARELGSLPPACRATGFDRTHVLLAGSIPMPSLLSLVAPLVLHSPVLAKTASRDPVTAPLVRESLLEIDPELGAALEIVSFAGGDRDGTRAFVDAGCLLATGSDETIARVRAGARPGTRIVAYGHRLSIAVIAADALAAETAAALSRDVAGWDQLGCLSAIAIFSVGAADAAIDDFAEALADALATREQEQPRGALDPDAAARLRAECDGARLRQGAGSDLRVLADEALRWAVIREADAELRPAPLHRFVRIHPVPDRAALERAVRPLSRHLAGVALAGFGDDHTDVAETLAALGASRICRPGLLQTPPLGWHHDNQPLLLPLARISDLETP